MTGEKNSYLENQYNLRAQHPEHYKVKEESRVRSDKVRETLPMKHDLRCGASERARFDLVLGKNLQKHQPAMIFIHGGFWRSGDKRDFAFLAEPFHDNGVATVLLNYSLAPATSLAAIIKEVRTSVINIMAQAPELGLDPDRVIIGGHSAGGHLAAMVESTDWTEFGIAHSPVYASFGISGLYDPRPLLRTSFQPILSLPENSNHLVAKSSKAAMHGLDLVACGSDETEELKSQSRRYANDVHMCLNYDPLHWEPQKDHYSILLALANAQSVLFRRVLSLFNL
jgi:arylformamidase